MTNGLQLSVIHSLLVSRFSVGSTLSLECNQAIADMKADRNYQYWHNRSLAQCYVKYQNQVAIGVDEVVRCDNWEYDSFCVKFIQGRACLLNTGFVEISTCVPHSCPDSSIPEIISSYFNKNTSSMDCSPRTSIQAPIVAAIVSTVSVLLITALAVYVLRPPQSVRESSKLSRARTELMSLSGTESNSS
jgi:hypothetical protein